MAELETVMISALEHYAYCPRQCALIHLEQTFDENIYTLRGHREHRRVDDPGASVDGVRRVERAMPLWSERLGLVGKADLVEFHEEIPYPVEYKSGKRRTGTPEKIQLCAQALCLEEMMGVAIDEGALYWIASRHRQRVKIDDSLRKLTIETIGKVRDLLVGSTIPSPVDDARCERCSLTFSCMPQTVEYDQADYWKEAR